MERSLYLIRHAETSEKQIGETDFQRALTTKGIGDAVALYDFLSANQIKFDTLLHSPANRTTQTASLLNKNLSTSLIEDKVIYTGTPSELFDRITHLPRQATSVAMVGHNPTISWLASELCIQSTPPFVPCTLLCLTFNLTTWRELTPRSGKLTLIKTPDIF